MENDEEIVVHINKYLETRSPVFMWVREVSGQGMLDVDDLPESYRDFPIVKGLARSGIITKLRNLPTKGNTKAHETTRFFGESIKLYIANPPQRTKGFVLTYLDKKDDSREDPARPKELDEILALPMGKCFWIWDGAPGDCSQEQTLEVLAKFGFGSDPVFFWWKEKTLKVQIQKKQECLRLYRKKCKMSLPKSLNGFLRCVKEAPRDRK